MLKHLGKEICAVIYQFFPFLCITDTKNEWVTLSCPESREKKWKWFVTQLKVKIRAEKSIQSKVSASFKFRVTALEQLSVAEFSGEQASPRVYEIGHKNV